MQIFSYLITEGKNPRIHLEAFECGVSVKANVATKSAAVVNSNEPPIQPNRKYQFFLRKKNKIQQQKER